MSTPTTQTSDTPAAPAAAGAVVASTATTATSSASSASVVTSTVTTSSSPKRTISVGEYHEKARSKPTYANETLFEELGIGGDVDMEEGEEERDSSSSGRNEASVGTRRPREADSDASSSKRSRSGNDRPLADAGALSTPRDGDDDDCTPSTAVTSRTNPVRDPWMPPPNEIQSRYGSTSPVGRWSTFVENFNRDPAGYRERVRSASERYERFSKRPKILRLHDGAVEAGIPCAVPSGVACARWQTGAVRLSERDLLGYTGISVPVELKTLREKLITQLPSESAEGERNTQPRAVGDYSSRSSFTPFGGATGGGIRTPSPFPERRSSGRSAAPTYRGQESILTNECENEPDLGSGSDDQRFGGQSSEFPHVRLATGAAVVGRRHGPSLAEVWDRLEAVERIQTAELAEIRQELKLLKARIGQAGQTASNIQVDLGSIVARLGQRVSALETRVAPSHRE
ncbi:hypothetical protein PR001_g26753 [Phytophthora rubi]|uniref:Uncharacterized protein n=1 Tax=Phytophthora rubi TaxID=129364 RepID=A0A6A3HPL9_9STRA|nr:hypothetical protein PR001_g26753 [Phytophthora rubi]